MSLDARSLDYEADLIRDPYSLKNWYYYLEYKADARPEFRYEIYERALRKLPGSFKLWLKYLTERTRDCKYRAISDIGYERLNYAYERALVHMHKMPRIWTEYLQVLMRQKKITQTRRTFDRALRALPVTQHQKWIWPLYLKFVTDAKVPETAIRVWRRYLKMNPLEVEDYIKYLKGAGRMNEAAVELAKIVNDEKFISQHGRSKHELWQDLLQIVTRHPQEVKSMNVDAIIRSGIKRFSHEVGRLWCALADYYIRLGHFEKARDVFEEGVNTVSTVRDFTMIFDAYTQYEESMLQAKMQAKEENKDEDEKDEDADSDDDEDLDIEMRVARLDDLMNRRPLLLSSVLLRQNPHNVEEWRKRVDLFKKDPLKTIATYTDAVTTIDPQKATGKPHTLWVAFAKFYEEHEDLENARVIMEKATSVNFKGVDDLASVWCEWAEMELRHQNYDKALEVLRKGCVVPSREVRVWKKGGQDNVPVQKKLYKSTKLWAFLADLEENMGGLEACREVYNQMIAIKVATPQIICNFAQLLEENNFFEESYRVYEKGIALFDYPHVYPIWISYIKRFIGRYAGTKVERVRDLFEQAVEKAPAAEGKKLYLLYAKFEEDFGMARRAMNIYDRACAGAIPKDRYGMYMIYVARCAEFFGLTKTRDIYEKAIQNLPEEPLKAMCLKYAALERKLGEIDRARAIYSYCSQYCNPKSETSFWRVWHDFEVMHGNEDTYRDMLRLRRSVQAQYSQANIVASHVIKPAPTKPTEPAVVLAPSSSIEALEQKVEADAEAEAKATTEPIADEKKSPTPAVTPSIPKNVVNPEEIALDLDDEDGEQEKDPSSRKLAPEEGALARFKKATAK